MAPAAEGIHGIPELTEVLASTKTERGHTLLELAENGTVLLIFLRHFGCSFCRQAISDVAAIAPELTAREVQPIFVHLGTPEVAKPYFDYYDLADVERISDPGAVLYSGPAFALARRHPLSHFLHFRNWQHWLGGGILQYGIGLLREDSYQMPGVFVLRGGAITRTFRFKTISDRPDYLALVA